MTPTTLARKMPILSKEESTSPLHRTRGCAARRLAPEPLAARVGQCCMLTADDRVADQGF